MEKIHKITVMESKDAVNIVRNTLKLVDSRLIDHGMRVAYLLYKMLANSDQYKEDEIMNICILGLFHDIGAYKTEEIDRLVEFETVDFLDHSIYGYLFVKFLTPLEGMAEAILYHHFDYKYFQKFDTDFEDIALMIHLADRADMLMQNDRERSLDMDVLERQAGTKFKLHHVQLLKQCDMENNVFDKLRDGSYEFEVQEMLERIHFTNEEISQYLRMLIYSIEFRSVTTVTHTVNTIYISQELAKLVHCSLEERARIFYGALLHDVGKIAIPIEILEYPGKLSDEDMEIMKKHVSITRSVIEGIIADEICEIASRHHEKPNGMGYPQRLSGDVLTKPQRIVAVADVISALSGERSYKKPFSPEKIKKIVMEMGNSGNLCPRLSALAAIHYEEIMKSVEKGSGKTLSVYFNIKKDYLKLQKRFDSFFEKEN